MQPTNCVKDDKLPKDAPFGNKEQTLCGDGTIEGSVCAEFLNHSDDAAGYAWLSANAQPPAQAFGSGADIAGQHSLLAGFMADGIPIYGFNGKDGTPPADLDECNGHASDLGFYHYHASTTYPYTAECLKGCLEGSGWANQVNAKACTGTGTTYDYSSVMSSWSFPRTAAPTTTVPTTRKMPLAEAPLQQNCQQLLRFPRCMSHRFGRISTNVVKT